MYFFLSFLSLIAESASWKLRKVGGLYCKSPLRFLRSLAILFKAFLIASPLKQSDTRITLYVATKQMCRGGRGRTSLVGSGCAWAGSPPGRHFLASRKGNYLSQLSMSWQGFSEIGRTPSFFFGNCSAKPPYKLLQAELCYWWFMLQNFAPCLPSSNVVEPNAKKLLDGGSCCYFCNFGLFMHNF